jgi:ureidoacrylate peracid hydrolase
MVGGVEVPRDEVALLLVDMQNGFCKPEGSFAKMTAGRGLSIELCEKAVGGCQRLLEAARMEHVPVVFTRYVYHHDYVDGGVLLEKYPEMKEIGSLAEGSWDANIVDELAPRPNEFVIDKSRYSSFYGTRLEPILNGLGVTSLVVGGVTTNVCVETTVRDASQRDYRVFVVSDATGELNQARHENALEIMAYGFGWVVESDEVLAAWRRSTAGADKADAAIG